MFETYWMVASLIWYRRALSATAYSVQRQSQCVTAPVMQLLHVPAHQLREGESPIQQSFASSRGNGGQLTAASPGTFPTRR